MRLAMNQHESAGTTFTASRMTTGNTFKQPSMPQIGYQTASEAYVFFSNDMTWAATTVWCFDYLLTIDKEIQYFWRSSWSLSKFLFLGYCYPPLLYILINIFATVPWPSWQGYHLCNLAIHADATEYHQHLLVAKCYVIRRAPRLRTVWSQPSAVRACLPHRVPKSCHFDPPVSSFQGCSLSISGGSTTSYEKWTIVARAASVLSDGIVLVLTMKKTYSNARQSAGLEVHDILLGAILRDVSVCFSLLCIMNIIGMGTARKTEYIDLSSLVKTGDGSYEKQLYSRLRVLQGTKSQQIPCNSLLSVVHWGSLRKKARTAVRSSHNIETHTVAGA
ncbi:hypothetical protein C8Q72DRAFT_288967 [Fomitopsis betulina]|nr:hypothetical protein C8Q72DRAFT_288967 [Fomitopsis betulina]